MKILKSLVLGVLATAGAWSLKADTVSYLSPVFDSKGAVTRYETKWAECTKFPTQSETSALLSGWYYVDTLSSVSSSLIIVGDVHLILKDNSQLIVNSGKNSRGGLCVEGAHALTIYAQSTNDYRGKLYAYGGKYAAGIGSGSMDGVACGTITINGGGIMAMGGKHAAGIGGGDRCNGRNITINGGVVVATAGSGGAGIGGGYKGDGRQIAINGGTVGATGGSNAAGIGSGCRGNCQGVTINGGDVNAVGGGDGAGIGSGDGLHDDSSTEHLNTAKDITINGGTVTATGKESGAGIGGGQYCPAKSITINGGKVTAQAGSGGGAGIGSGGIFSVKWKDRQPQGGAYRLKGVKGSDITINGGEVSATGGNESAGIGGGIAGDAENIVITGGIVHATGGDDGAGIGGGSFTIYMCAPFTLPLISYNGCLKNMRISGGTVYATGKGDGFDIGRGCTHSSYSRYHRSTNFVFTGGSIVTLRGRNCETTPRNAAGAYVYKTPITEVCESPAVIEGIPNYGTKDLYPDSENKLYFYLPAGAYTCRTTTQRYYGTANSGIYPVGAYYGVTVNGLEAGVGSGDGWTCSDGVLTLSAAKNYILAGSSSAARLRVQVTANATVTLDNLTLPLAADAPCFAFGSGASDAKLVLTNDNTVYAQNGYPAVDVASGAKVTLSGDGSLTGGGATGVNSRGVYNNGILVMTGGMLRNYRTPWDGGAIYNKGTVTMEGGTLSGNAAASGSALFNDGTASIYGGVFIDNSASPVSQGQVHGGVFDRAPEGVVIGSEAMSVGGRFVVGKDIAQRNGQLTGGTYTFDPTNDEYAGAGVKVFSNCIVTPHAETTPKTYVVRQPEEFRINGMPLADGSGTGWSFDPATGRLSLTNAMAYALSGQFEAAFAVDVTENATVSLTDVRIVPGDLGHEIFNVAAADVRFSLGGSNEVYTTDGHAAIGVAGGAKLTLDGDGALVGGRASDANGRCVTVAAGGAFVMDGGSIADYYTTTNGAAVYNGGTFTMNDGTVSGNAALNGGALFNGGTATISGGMIKNNTASKNGGFCYCDKDCATYIYGGFFSGNAAPEVQKSNLYHGHGRQHNGLLYGGVFAADPTSQAESGDAGSGSCLELQNGTAVSVVGKNYIVGKGVTQTDDKLTGGTYYFDLTRAEYAEAGVSLAKQYMVETMGTDPETYRVHVAANFKVDGVRLEEGTGTAGWTFTQDGEKGYLTLASARAYELTGYADLTLLVDVISNATVTLNGARIRAGKAGREIISVSAEDATIVLMGTNTIYATDGHAAIGVAAGANLTVKGDGALVGGRTSGANGRGFSVWGELVIEGGTVRDYYTSADGGAVYNVGTFTMKGGTVSGCAAKCGGALCNSGTATFTGGTVTGNAATSYGGFCYCNNGCRTDIFGGCFSGNVAPANNGNLYHGYGRQHNGFLYGGVFAADPMSGDESSDLKGGSCLVLQGGTTVSTLGDGYIVGKDVTTASDLLTGGTYYFDPEDDLYAATGVALAEEHVVFELATDPKTYMVALNRTGFTVDGTDIITGSGDGWTYDVTSGLLSLDSVKTYVLSGECTREDLDLGVTVGAAATVILSNATITTTSALSPLTANASGVMVLMVGENNLTAAALPAIAVADGASVTIARGVAVGETAKLVAVGGANAKAIGGEGDVTIASGRVSAQGGIAGGSVRIEGGTVTATGRSGEPDIDGATVRITGGSVVAGSVTSPKNAEDASVYCVTVPDVYQQGPVAITNQAYLADAYGQTDLYPAVSGMLCLWLPSGTYDKFFVGEDAGPYYATVASGPTVAYRKVLALYVNDELVDENVHKGWNYDGEVLTLDGTTNSYDVVGESMDGAVRIVVQDGSTCDVTISGVRLGKDDLEEGQNLIAFGDGSQINLILDGLTAFKTNDGIAPIRVGDGAIVNICGSGTVFAWKVDIDGTGRVTMEDPTALSFATQAAAEAAARVIKPLADESEFPGINQVAYGDRFVVSAVASESGTWTLDYQMSEATSNLIQQTVFSAGALSNLVESVVGGSPSVAITPIPGFYYGMAGATEVTEMDADTARPPAWYAGQEGKELTVHGMTFQDAVKAFYQLRARAKP